MNTPIISPKLSMTLLALACLALSAAAQEKFPPRALPAELTQPATGQAWAPRHKRKNPKRPQGRSKRPPWKLQNSYQYSETSPLGWHLWNADKEGRKIQEIYIFDSWRENEKTYVVQMKEGHIWHVEAYERKGDARASRQPVAVSAHPEGASPDDLNLKSPSSLNVISQWISEFNRSLPAGGERPATARSAHQKTTSSDKPRVPQSEPIRPEEDPLLHAQPPSSDAAAPPDEMAPPAGF